MANSYLTIGEAARELDVPDYVLRFWEKKFKVIHPSKRRGGRRYYSKDDIETIKKIKSLLHNGGYTIKGANVILNNKFVEVNSHMSNVTSVKKNSKKQQADLFGPEELTTDAKEKLKQLLERLEKAREVLAQTN